MVGQMVKNNVMMEMMKILMHAPINVNQQLVETLSFSKASSNAMTVTQKQEMGAQTNASMKCVEMVSLIPMRNVMTKIQLRLMIALRHVS